MEDDYSPDKRVAQLTKDLVAAYVLLRRFLAQLPIAIGLPEFAEDWDAVTVIPAVDRARELVLSEPISQDHAWMIEKLLLDWLTAYELRGLVAMAGPALWRLDAMEFAFQRLTTIADEIASELGIEIWPSE